jgi:hypothetical protein
MMLSSTNKGGRLELAARHHERRAGIEIAGSKFPGAQEIADIIARDLGERRKPRAAAISSPLLPAERRCGSYSVTANTPRSLRMASVNSMA